MNYVIIETKRSIIIISECSKSAQRDYKAKHVWVGKVIHRELCKKSKIDQTYKCYMHTNLESVLENETHKLLLYFEIQMDNLISARGLDFVMVNKKKVPALPFRLTTGQKWKKRKRDISNQDLARELQITIEHESDNDTHCNCYARFSHQKFGTRTGNKRTHRDHPNYIIDGIGKNTEDCPGDLRTLAVS